jgi:hypothetical protein
MVGLVVLSSFPVTAECMPWGATFYGGPSTNKFFSQIFIDGRFAPDGAMFGIAVNPRLAYLGWGVSLEGEGQVTAYTFGHNYQSFALGVGLRHDGSAFGHRLSFAAYTGPSFAIDPPAIGIGFGDTPAYFAKKHWLNYVGIEVAVALHKRGRWEGVFRLYHRSGAWGLYSIAADEGTTLGIGLRLNFDGT